MGSQVIREPDMTITVTKTIIAIYKDSDGYCFEQQGMKYGIGIFFPIISGSQRIKHTTKETWDYHSSLWDDSLWDDNRRFHFYH